MNKFLVIIIASVVFVVIVLLFLVSFFLSSPKIPVSTERDLRPIEEVGTQKQRPVTPTGNGANASRGNPLPDEVKQVEVVKPEITTGP